MRRKFSALKNRALHACHKSLETKCCQLGAKCMKGLRFEKRDDRFTAHHVIHAHMLVRCLIYRQRKSSFCFFRVVCSQQSHLLGSSMQRFVACHVGRPFRDPGSQRNTDNRACCRNAHPNNHFHI